MSALSSKSGEWQTPPWLVEKCRAALGGHVSLDPCAGIGPGGQNNVGAYSAIYKAGDGLSYDWLRLAIKQQEFFGIVPTLFVNPPGERSGKLVRRFWAKWNAESRKFHASVWVDFNLDHLRFITRVPADALIIPRKRLAFVDPVTGKERRGAQIGGFLLFRGYYALGGGPNGMPALFPEPDFLTMRGEP